MGAISTRHTYSPLYIFTQWFYSVLPLLSLGRIELKRLKRFTFPILVSVSCYTVPNNCMAVSADFLQRKQNKHLLACQQTLLPPSHVAAVFITTRLIHWRRYWSCRVCGQVRQVAEYYTVECDRLWSVTLSVMKNKHHWCWCCGRGNLISRPSGKIL